MEPSKTDNKTQTAEELFAEIIKTRSKGELMDIAHDGIRSLQGAIMRSIVSENSDLVVNAEERLATLRTEEHKMFTQSPDREDIIHRAIFDYPREAHEIDMKAFDKKYAERTKGLTPEELKELALKNIEAMREATLASQDRNEYAGQSLGRLEKEKHDIITSTPSSAEAIRRAILLYTPEMCESTRNYPTRKQLLENLDYW